MDAASPACSFPRPRGSLWNDQQTETFFHPLSSFSLKTLGSCSPGLYFMDQNSALPCGSHLECSLCLRHFSPQSRCRRSLNFPVSPPLGSLPLLGLASRPSRDSRLADVLDGGTDHAVLPNGCFPHRSSQLAHGERFTERAESRAVMSPFLLCYLAIFLEPCKFERVRCVWPKFISRICSFESTPAINVPNSNPALLLFSLPVSWSVNVDANHTSHRQMWRLKEMIHAWELQCVACGGHSVNVHPCFNITKGLTLLLHVFAQ